MSLAEYQSDQRLLLERLSKTDSEGPRFVEAYLRVRKYTDDELLLLIQITEEQASQKALEVHINWRNRIPEPQDYLTEDMRPVDKPTKVAWQPEQDLIVLLSKRLKTPLYPFKPINPRYLVAPDKSDKVEIAEIFMIQFEWFNKDGKWNENRAIGELITFINLLITSGILKYTTEKDMDAYFSKRYKLETLGALLRPNKLKLHVKFDEFFILRSRLGIK